MTFLIIALTWYGTWRFFRIRPEDQNRFLFFPYHFSRGLNTISIVTSVLIHSDWRHFFFNMIGFYFFGPFLEYEIGPLKLILLYFGSAIVGSLAIVSLHRNNSRYRALGASGAVYGVVFAFIAMHPLLDLQFIFLPIKIPAVVMGLIYLMMSIMMFKRGQDNIAHEAHIGGAVGGIIFGLLIRLF
ncbi:MAG: rhomboid family intramembrane serine protease [Calditrichaeota bacterium]|nr:rhomboid family intramembrane serine protease [Calditrichota bacterium]